MRETIQRVFYGLTVVVLVSSCAPQNRSAEKVASYQAELRRAGSSVIVPGSRYEKEALARFEGILKNIGNEDYLRANVRKTYAADAYLNDTLVTRHGAQEIEAYFLKTSRQVTGYRVTIEDVSRSGSNYYVRWTLEFAAPALALGTPVHSIGISQVRFDASGKVTFHQDFWDSGDHFFGKLPVAGGVIGFIRKRLE